MADRFTYTQPMYEPANFYDNGVWMEDAVVCKTLNQLTADLADTKAAWERDVRINAELRAKQVADLAAVRAKCEAYEALLNESASKLPAKHGDLIEAIDTALATPADPQAAKEAPSA